MQKALIASAFFIFFILNVAGQKIMLSGTYCSAEYITDFEMCFTFKNNNTFTFRSGNDLPPDIVGEGTFQIANKLLHLNYKYSDPYILSYHKISQTFSNQDSITYHFKAKDIAGVAIPGTEVIFKNPETKIPYGIILDKEGEGKLILLKSADPLQLRFSYVGYNPLMIELKRDNDYYLEVFLAKQGQILPITPHKETYDIINVQNEYITLNNKGELSKWFKSDEQN